MFTQVLLCLILVAGTILIHYETLITCTKFVGKLKLGSNRLRVLLIIFCLFAGHLLEILLYAIGYYLAVEVFEIGAFAGDAAHSGLSYFYFSGVSYTSLGFGEIYPLKGIRILTMVQAMNGLLLIAWSASFTYLMMERLWRLKDKN